MLDIVKAKIPAISLVLSAIVAWLLIPIQSGFPFVPFSILFISLATLVFILRKDKSWFEIVLLIGVIALSCFELIRANDTIQFINFIFVILFGSLMVLPIAMGHTLANLFLTPFSVFNQIISGKSIYSYSLSAFKGSSKAGFVRKYIPSFIVTIVFLLITIPLLSSANPLFNQLVQNTIKTFNLQQFVKFLFGNEPVFIIIRFIFFVILAVVIPKILTAVVAGVTTKNKNFYISVNYLFPKVAMGILLIIFFVTQMQLYFATADELWKMGYTNSRLTNEIFFQVTVVAFIIFFLAYIDRVRGKWNRILSYFLIVEAFFLVGIAFKSVNDYSMLWGLTQKRLWGYATMTWLSGALLLFVYFYNRKVALISFFRYMVTFTIVVLVGINLANFDYLIAHYSQARTQQGLDYRYLARLSPDGEIYRESLNQLVVESEKNNSYDFFQSIAIYNLLGDIERLQREYGKKEYFNSFNLSEYKEYLDVKDINIESYRKKINDRDQKFINEENARNQKMNNELNPSEVSTQH